MNALLDTHALLWFLLGDKRLSDTARGIIEDPGNEIAVSVASLWEISIKVSIGKLTLHQPFEVLFPDTLNAERIALLPLRVEHLRRVILLPFYHRDPFDRLLIAQAAEEQAVLVTRDAVFSAYNVTTQW